MLNGPPAQANGPLAPIAPVYFNSHRILVQQWVKGFEGNPNNLHPSRFMSVEK
jgi:hypothetical protein